MSKKDTTKEENHTSTAKEKAYRFLGGLFFLIAIAVALYPIVANTIADNKRMEVGNSYNKTVKKLSKSERKHQFAMAHSYNKMLSAEYAGTKQYQSPYKYNQILNLPHTKGLIATIDVPSIKIKSLPIYHGTSEKVLSYGIGHMPYTSFPVGGKNTRPVVAGHSGLMEQLLFTNVLQMKKGDKFYFNVLGKIYAYKVYKTQVINPKNPNSIKQTYVKAGHEDATLYTCTPLGVNTHRLLVTGKRVPYHSGDESKGNRDTFNYNYVVLVIFLLLLLLWGLKKLYDKYKETHKKEGVNSNEIE